MGRNAICAVEGAAAYVMSYAEQNKVRPAMGRAERAEGVWNEATAQCHAKERKERKKKRDPQPKPPSPLNTCHGREGVRACMRGTPPEE